MGRMCFVEWVTVVGGSVFCGKFNEAGCVGVRMQLC
jgi:hypothetical protein